MELSEKAGTLGRPRAGTDHNYSEEDYANRRVGGGWIQITNVGSIKTEFVVFGWF